MVGRFAAWVGVMVALAGPVAGQDTRNDIRLKGHLTCGVVSSAPAYFKPDPMGETAPTGFDVDLCRTLAVALLGDSAAYRIDYLPPRDGQDRRQKLADGKVDLIIRAPVTEAEYDLSADFRMPVVLQHDSLSLHWPAAFGAARAAELDGARICVHGSRGPVFATLGAALKARGLIYEAIAFSSANSSARAFAAQGCDAIAGPDLELASVAERMTDEGRVALSREPLAQIHSGPVLRRDDESWAMLVKYVLGGLLVLDAEAIDPGETAELTGSARAYQARVADSFALSGNWLEKVARQVGSYESLRATHLNGAAGLNALTDRGGLLAAPSLAPETALRRAARPPRGWRGTITFQLRAADTEEERCKLQFDIRNTQDMAVEDVRARILAIDHDGHRIRGGGLTNRWASNNSMKAFLARSLNGDEAATGLIAIPAQSKLSGETEVEFRAPCAAIRAISFDSGNAPSCVLTGDTQAPDCWGILRIDSAVPAIPASNVDLTR